MKNFKEFAIPTVALFLICLVATALLAVTNNVTAPKIAELAEQTEVETRQKVLPAATGFGETQKMKTAAALTPWARMQTAMKSVMFSSRSPRATAEM